MKEKRQKHDWDRKAAKRKSHNVVRSHYVFLLFICLVLMFVGLEYNQSTAIFDEFSSTEQINSIASGAIVTERATDVFDDMLNGRYSTADKRAEKKVEKYRKDTKKGDVLGRSRGAFASLVNSISSGQLYVQLALALKNLSHSKDVATVVLILLFSMVFLSISIFIKIPITAVVRRIFLEARTYKKVPVHDAVFIQSTHRWFRVCRVLILDYIVETLLWFTIIGGIWAYFTYAMVPYIVAENPDIKPLEAMRLSRRMMKGHRWEYFVLNVTFIPWYLLAAFTIGVSDMLYAVPYRIAVYTEYYTHLRECAKLDKVEGADRLNDACLFEHAPAEEVHEAYKDIKSVKEYTDTHHVELKSWQKFFIKNFGVWLGSTAEKNEYQKIESMRFRAEKEQDVISGDAYPRRLNPLYDEKSVDLEGTVSAFRCYTVWSLILMFFAFSFVGWAWEVSLHLITDGVFVNRGTMHGPWLPIYGFGAIYILVFLNRFRKNVFVQFAGAVVLSGFVEYMTSWYLEVTKGMRWWDYTGYFLNLNGRICGEGLLIFGLGGIAVVYLIAPLLDEQISKIKGRPLIAACLILLAAYNIDGIYTKSHPNVGKGITDYTAYEETDTKGTPDKAPEGSSYDLRLY